MVIEADSKKAALTQLGEETGIFWNSERGVQGGDQAILFIRSFEISTILLPGCATKIEVETTKF